MTQQKKKQSKLTIVAVAHNEPVYNRMFLDSMINQTNGDWRAIIYHNGHNEEMAGIESRDERFEYEESDIDTGNWGTANRQYAIDECSTEYIIQTSIQDVWLPQAMEYIIKTIERAQPDLIIWDSINHLVGPCKVLESKLEWAKIDWGNFCIRTDIAKKVRIKQSEYCADWFYINDLIAGGFIDPNKILKLPYVLTIHN